MTDQENYAKARKKVEARIGFYIHLVVFFVVNTMLIILNLVVTGGYFWAMWPMIGWGSGLIAHGLFTFVFTAEPSLKERMIEKEMRKGGTQ
jgi:hypothetical protein